MYIFRSEFVLAIFIIHLILLVFALYARTIKSKYLDFVILTFSCLVLLTVAFTRPGFGVDEPSYLSAFIEFKNNNDSFPFDYSFRFLYSLLELINIGDDDFNNVISALYIILLYLTVIATSKNFYKSLYFIMLSFSFTSLDLMFNAYRQAFALIFVYNAIFCFIDKKSIKGSILTIISFGFHWSSLIILLFYFCSKIIKGKTAYFILLLIFPFVCLSMVTPLGLMGMGYHILSFLPLNDVFKNHVLAYLETDNIANSSFYILNVFGKIPLAISVLSFYLFILIFYKQIENKKLIPMISLTAIYCLVFMEMAYSFRNYYWVLPFFPIITISYAESNQNRVNQRMIGIVLLHIVIAFPTFYSAGINSMIFNTNS